MGLAITTALAAGLVATLTGASDIRTASRDVRLADVATVRGQGAEMARRAVIVRIRQGSKTSVSRRELAELIRRAVPGVRVRGKSESSILLSSAEHPQSSAQLKPYVPGVPAIERGQKLILTATAGPVVIERPVVALQDARKTSKRLFVRSENGQVFSAPVRTGAAQ